jgi:hypothetical protein
MESKILSHSSIHIEAPTDSHDEDRTIRLNDRKRYFSGDHKNDLNPS